nr:DNA alkylation repair protein [uncultured Allomuricauda sp.]
MLTTFDFPAKNPRTQTRNYSYSKPLLESSTKMTAREYINRLSEFKSEKELNKAEKFFKGNDGVTKSFGVKFGDVFKTAKEFTSMPLTEINKLLDNEHYEIRMGAVSIMDYQARSKKTSENEKKSSSTCIYLVMTD